MSRCGRAGAAADGCAAQCSSIRLPIGFHRAMLRSGGMEALTCLQQHNASLSKSCREAISNLEGPKKSSNEAPAQPDVTPPSTTAAAAPKQSTAAQRDAVKSSCRSDFMAQCSGVTPGGAQALACLQQHSATLSPSCQAAVGALGGDGATQATSPAKPPAGGGAVATPMASFTPREELVVVRRSCGPDFRALCHSVPLGGGRGINCLRDNFARLAPACQRVLSNGL